MVRKYCGEYNLGKVFLKLLKYGRKIKNIHMSRLSLLDKMIIGFSFKENPTLGLNSNCCLCPKLAEPQKHFVSLFIVLERSSFNRYLTNVRVETS